MRFGEVFRAYWFVDGKGCECRWKGSEIWNRVRFDRMGGLRVPLQQYVALSCLPFLIAV